MRRAFLLGVFLGLAWAQSWPEAVLFPPLSVRVEACLMGAYTAQQNQDPTRQELDYVLHLGDAVFLWSVPLQSFTSCYWSYYLSGRIPSGNNFFFYLTPQINVPVARELANKTRVWLALLDGSGKELARLPHYPRKTELGRCWQEKGITICDLFFAFPFVLGYQDDPVEYSSQSAAFIKALDLAKGFAVLYDRGNGVKRLTAFPNTLKVPWVKK